MALFAFLCLSALTSTWAYGTGAPSSACGTMTPNHGVDAQTSASPFTINLSKTTVTNDGTESIVVTIPQQLRGLLLKLEAGDQGTFSALSTGIKVLSGCGVTHSDRTDKAGFSVTWTPKSGFTGKSKFVATIVQVKVMFWKQVTSAEIEVVAPQTTTATTSAPAPATTQAPAPATTQAPAPPTAPSTGSSSPSGPPTTTDEAQRECAAVWVSVLVVALGQVLQLL